MRSGLKARVLYLGAMYLGAAIQFLLLPYFANALGVSEFGLFAYYYALVNWVAFLSTLGTQTQIRKYIIGMANLRLAKKYTSELVSLVVMLLLVCLSLFAVYASLYKAVSAGEMLALALYVFSYVSLSIFSSMLIARQNVVPSAVWNAIATCLPLLIFVVASYQFEMGWSSRFWFASVVMIAIVLLNLKFFKKEVDLRTKLKFRREWCHLKGSLRIALHSLYDKLVSQGDKLLVAYLFGVKSLAIYALGSQIANIIHMSLKAFSVFSENIILSRSSKAVSSCLSTALAGLVFCAAFYVAIVMVFDHFFASDFAEVLNILFIQFLIVLTRVLAGLVFTVNLVGASHMRNICIEYGSLIAWSIIGIVLELSSLSEFCLLILAATTTSLLMNIALSFLDHHRTRPLRI